MNANAKVNASVAAALFTVGFTSGPNHPTAATSAQAEMVSAAQHFVSLLDRDQRSKAVYDFEDDTRFDWHFVPRQRTGLPFREMTTEQRTAGHRLLRSTLSATGYRKANGIIQLEQILGIIEGRPQRRDPEAYFFWIFGTPSVSQPWAWRFEGHHLSVNFTSVADSVVVSTPAFMGANPATVPSGPFAGTRFLGAEEDHARALLLSLTPEQREHAIIAREAPRDIITGADREANIATVEGLPVSEMNAHQRTLIHQLLMEYVGNMASHIAHRQLAKIESAGEENLHFAWAGSAQAGEGHYYRIHGPTVLIEYDNTQNDANHVHSVWRDLTDDFGGDVLRRHYDDADHH